MQINGCWISDMQAVNGLPNVDYSILINIRMRLKTYISWLYQFLMQQQICSFLLKNMSLQSYF